MLVTNHYEHLPLGSGCRCSLSWSVGVVGESGEWGVGGVMGDAGDGGDGRARVVCAVCRCGTAVQAAHTTSLPVYVTFSPEGNARL